ncbi:hypothetical protein [Shewanella surugensis]|uniref:GH18 domain-containing protein n=1 Tax=Shewanella surugensis TaxID=212020 RepID=A0ABT0LJA5_9GAMM|nr:hypothetical protein [Shewanella surugensis]MCL1127789.1 hypothetical protein [Shewanella surugensis]
MSLIQPNNVFFYLQGSDVIQPSSEQPFILERQKSNQLSRLTWGMFYCDPNIESLNKADQLYIWSGAGGNLFSNPIYTTPIIDFAKNGGKVGVTLGGNPPMDDSLVNPIDKLYNRPNDFIALIQNIDTQLEGNLSFIDIDIEDPQLDNWTEAHWLALNNTLSSIRNHVATEQIKLQLTIPQASSYWSAKSGYQSLISSNILKITSLDMINIMDMDTQNNTQQQWVQWVTDTTQVLCVPESKTCITFQSIGLSDELFYNVIDELTHLSPPYQHIGLFTAADGQSKFIEITQSTMGPNPSHTNQTHANETWRPTVRK